MDLAQLLNPWAAAADVPGVAAAAAEDDNFRSHMALGHCAVAVAADAVKAAAVAEGTQVAAAAAEFAVDIAAAAAVANKEDSCPCPAA